MSYCRFSSDDDKSDVYCLGTGGEYVTHLTHREDPNRWADIFTDGTLAKFQSRLLGFRESGYHIPQVALDRIEREMEASDEE